MPIHGRRGYTERGVFYLSCNYLSVEIQTYPGISDPQTSCVFMAVASHLYNRGDDLHLHSYQCCLVCTGYLTNVYGCLYL